MSLFGPGDGLSAWRRHRRAPEPPPAPVPLLQDPVRWAPKLEREQALHLQLQGIHQEVWEASERGIRDDPDLNRQIQAMYDRVRQIRAELDT